MSFYGWKEGVPVFKITEIDNPSAKLFLDLKAKKFSPPVSMWILVFVMVLVLVVWCISKRENITYLPGWGRCPHHCNCAVYTSDGKWVKCQRAKMTFGCKPHHRDRVCRNAARGWSGVGQFKVGCCGASCGEPGSSIGHALDCRLENEVWRGHLRSCNFAGEDLRCHK